MNENDKLIRRIMVRAGSKRYIAWADRDEARQDELDERTSADDTATFFGQS